MGERLFNAPKGFEDANGIARLSGSGAPGGDASYEDNAIIGSIYSDFASGEVYRKHTAGAGAGNWELMPKLSDITGFGNTRSWREPADLYTTDTQANLLVDANTDDTVQGVTIVADQRILINDGVNPNVFIVGGSTGAWTLTEDTNPETNGDTVKVLYGDEAGNEYTYNGTAWIWTDNNTGAEDGFQNSFMGKSSVGSELPSYSSTNVVANNDTLTTAIGKLDTQVNTNATNISTNTGNISTNTTNITNAQNEIDAIESAIGAVISTAGAYVAHSGTNYIDGNTSVTADLLDLDTQLGTVSTNAGNAQTEIDAIETASGSIFGTDGTYTAATLDALGNVTASTSLSNAIGQLDSAITTNTGNISTNTTNITSLETSLGSLVNSSGVYVPNTGTTYLNGNASITEDLEDLDSALNTTSGNVSNLQTEVDAIETAMGAVIDANGDYVAHTGTNYLNTNTSVTADLLDLDTAVGTNATNITNLQTEVDNIETASGGIFSAAGTFSGTGLDALDNVTASSSLLNAIGQIDTAVSQNNTDIGNLNYSSNNYVTDSTDLTTAIGALDAAVASVGNDVFEETLSGATTQQLSSVLVDDAFVAKWLVVVTDEVSGNREAVEIFALHNGTAGADATVIDWTQYSKLDTGSNIAGFDIDVTLNGASTAQVMRLTITATNNITATALRLAV